MSEFISDIDVTVNNRGKLEKRIKAHHGMMKAALKKANLSKPGEKALKMKKAAEYRGHMNRLLDHWPDGKPRDIGYVSVTQDADHQVQTMREALDKEPAA